MEKQFSLAQLTVMGCSPLEMIDIAARNGYDFVSLRLIPMGLCDETPCITGDKELIRNIKTALNETGIKLLDIEVAQIADNKDPKQYLFAMETAAELGACHVISSAWGNDQLDRQFIIDSFSELCDLAKPLGLTVDMEFPSFSHLKTLQQAADIVRSANCENGGILIDTLYLHFSKARLEELDKIPKNWFHFMHLNDTACEIPGNLEEMKTISRENRLYLGEGCIDFKSILSHIPPIPYSIELPNKNNIKKLGFDGHALQCIKKAKQVLSC